MPSKTPERDWGCCTLIQQEVFIVEHFGLGEENREEKDRDKKEGKKHWCSSCGQVNGVQEIRDSENCEGRELPRVYESITGK